MPDNSLPLPTSISFDRAASFYDATRPLPPGVADEVAAGLCRLAGLSPGDRLLELGVGTGRLALPLSARGLAVFGIDLSPRMLDVLRTKASSCLVVEGDIAALPLADGAFAAILAVHVLHLVGGWRAALAEAARVLRPGGAFLLGWSQQDESSPLSQVRRRWREITAALGGRVGRPGEEDPQRIAAALGDLGFRRVAEGTVAAWRARSSPAEAARAIAARTFSDSWDVPDDLLQASLAQLRPWMERRYADPEAPAEVPHAFHSLVLRRPPG